MKSVYLFLRKSLLLLILNSFALFSYAQVEPQHTVAKTCMFYEQISSITSLNKAYSKRFVRFGQTREGLINDLGFVKCIIERSFIAQSFEVLNKIRFRVKKEDPYIQGVYKMVFARLYYKVNKPKESVRLNDEAIELLTSIPPTVDLKQAYINQGFFLSNKTPKQAFGFYQNALKMEHTGCLEMKNTRI